MTGIVCNLVGNVVTAAAAVRTAKTVTAVGNAQVDTAQSKFGGAAALFDGTGDRLTVTSDADFAFSGDFTIEFFIRWNARTHGTNYILFDGRLSTDGSVVKPTIYHVDSSLRYFVNGADRITSATLTINNGVWYHYALSRSGSSTRLFVDGTQVGSTYTDNNTYVQSALSIGDYAGTGYGLNGWIDEVRISNTARYTANFTAPSAAFTNDSNTLMLLHCDGTDASTTFTDDTGSRVPKTITAIGNAQISTAQSKFGGSSMLNDGTGDALRIESNADFGYGTGDFCIEFWIRPTTNLSGTYNVWDQRADGAGVEVKPSIYISGNTLYYYTNNDNRISYGIQLQSGTWYHIAVSRSGSSTKMWLDGTQVGSTYTDNNNYVTSQVIISNYSAGGGNYYYATPAYFDEIRISKGTARYTANFTAPTTAFTNDANTVLLIHADGTNGSTTFTDDNA